MKYSLFRYLTLHENHHAWYRVKGNILEVFEFRKFYKMHRSFSRLLQHRLESKLKSSIKPITLDEVLLSGRDYAYFFFKKHYIEVSADGVEKKDYSGTSKYVFSDDIIDFGEYDDNVDYTDADIYRFTKNICTNPNNGELIRHKYEEIIDFIGSMLHDYYDEKNKIIILTNDPDGKRKHVQAEKSLFMEGIEKLRKTEKETAIGYCQKSHMSRDISWHTKIFLLDNVYKFEQVYDKLYIDVTYGLRIRYKGYKMDIPKVHPIKFVIIFMKSPDKLPHYINERVISLTRYYNADRTPISDFGRRLYYDWDKSEWKKFYKFMIDCVIQYFRNRSKNKIVVSQ